MLIIRLTMDVARALRAVVVDYEGQRPMEMVEVVIVIIVIVVMLEVNTVVVVMMMSES